MKKLMAVLMLAGVFCFTMLAPVCAQENAADEDKFSFGQIVSIGEGQITVKEYDFAKDADVETVYYLTSETEFGNVNTVKDLIVGDDIVLDYSEKDGKRTVTTLVKEEKGAEIPVADVPADVAAEAVMEEVPAAPVAEAAPVVPAAEPAPVVQE